MTLEVRLRQTAPIPLDADLVCATGEVLAVVGPSGSGKTTILRCIAGLHHPQEGHVRCNGAIWLDSAARISLPPHRRAVGVVFQSYGLFPHLDAADNVATALGHLKRGARADRARELLRRVHLEGLEHRRPAELSGGQQQRVAVARALARDPDVLLLDEPFSAVDRVTRQKLQRELAELRRTLGIPIVLVTHDLDEACLLADRMSILHHGRTLQTGTPADVMNRPASVEVARLVDLRNVFDGRIVSAPDSILLEWGPYRLEVSPDVSFPPGSAVSWAVPVTGLVMHRRERPSRGERENPVPGVVTDMVTLGDAAHVTLAVSGFDDTKLHFTVPGHVARRNGLAPGVEATVSILAEHVHLMPWEHAGDQRRGRTDQQED